MSLIRLFVPDALSEGASLRLTPAQGHYLGTVMRRAVGEPVRLFNGRDGEWEGAITTLARGVAVIALRARMRAQAASPDVWLLTPVLRRERLEWLVEKATELGACRILPVITTRSVPARGNATRLAAIATEAAEQCRRLDVPVVDEPAPLATLLGGWNPARRLLVGDESGAALPIAAVLAAAPAPPLAVLVGPEGGFTSAELDGLRKLAFCQPVALGPRILRAETAGLAMLALVQALVGDWQQHHLS